MLAYDITREIDCQWEIAEQSRNDTRTVVKIPPVSIKDLIEMGEDGYVEYQGPNHGEMNWLEKRPKGGHGKKMPKNPDKQQNDIRRAMKRLKGLVRTNFGRHYSFERQAHLTLTYQGAMHCRETLEKNLKSFIRLMRKHHPEHEFAYIAVMEPHASGGWHIHMLLKSNLPLWHDNGVVGLCYKKTRELWRKAIKRGGAVRHSRLPEDREDLGTYFTAYFSTIIPDEVEASGDREAMRAASKAAVKGSRLKFYPSGFKFYRCSRNIERPVKTKEPIAGVLTGYEAKITGSFGINVEDDRKQTVQTHEIYKQP